MSRLGKVSCFVSTCVSSDNSFPSVGQECTQGPFLQQMATRVGPPLCYDWHPEHSGCLGTSSPVDGLGPAAATGVLSSLFPSLHRQLARLMWLGKEQETLLISFPFFPLPFFFSTPPILPTFLLVWFWTQESGWRASISLIWGLEPDVFHRAKNSNSDPVFGTWFLLSGWAKFLSFLEAQGKVP